jgi:energy-converting hydrogenase Eha subunit B
MAATGVMQFWPAVVTASLDQAPLLLHQAGVYLLQPLPLATLLISAVLVLIAGHRLSKNISGFAGDAGSMAAAVLITTLWVDGLFLLSALLQPGLSGLIE